MREFEDLPCEYEQLNSEVITEAQGIVNSIRFPAFFPGPAVKFHKYGAISIPSSRR